MKRKNLDEDIEITFHSESTWNIEKLEVHDYYELNVAMSNSGKFFVEGKVYELKRGMLLAINNVTLHRNVSENLNYPRCVIKFVPQILDKFFTSNTNILSCFYKNEPAALLTESQLKYYLDIVKKMQDEQQSKEFGSDILLKSHLVELLIYVNRIYKDFSPSENNINTLQSNMTPILQYINDHCSENLSLTNIAKQFYISKSHLCSIFKSSIGLTVNDYIIECRLSKAKELMIQNLSLQKVCDESGFNSYASFSRSFKLFTGVSPKEYKKKVTN